MSTKSKIVRWTLGACLAIGCLAGGSGLLKPSQANAAEIIVHRPWVRVVHPIYGGTVVTTPIVAGPVVTGPVVRTIYAHPIYHPFAYRFWRR
jgi:hypothetical protein